MASNDFTYEVIFVNDGSTDRSWNVIEELAEKNEQVKGIDADLQDDENVIVDMVRQVQEGKDIIYGSFPGKYMATDDGKLAVAMWRWMPLVPLSDLEIQVKWKW